MIEEIWKDVKNYEGLYEVSNLGRVKSLFKSYIRKHPRSNKYILYKKKERLLNCTKNAFGYPKVLLFKDNKSTHLPVHRLVCQSFLENPNNFILVNHLDGNPSNNNVSNLEWCDAFRNCQHAFDVGLNNHKGNKHTLAKLNEDIVKEIRYRAENENLTVKKLSEDYDVDYTTVWSVVKRKTWKHI